MIVKVRFLAPFKDLFGGRERSLDLPAAASVRELMERLGDTAERRHELLSGRTLRPGVIVLRNGEPAGLDDPLEDGDTVAVFPLLAGG